MDKSTLLLRQVHPSWVQGENFSQLVFSSQTFTPTKKDEGLLSVYHGDKFSPKESHEKHSLMGLQSAGVVAVSKAECDDIGVNVFEDNKPFDGHCNLDYRKMTSGEVKKTAAALKIHATKRGWLYKKETA